MFNLLGYLSTFYENSIRIVRAIYNQSKQMTGKAIMSEIQHILVNAHS